MPRNSVKALLRTFVVAALAALPVTLPSAGKVAAAPRTTASSARPSAVPVVNRNVYMVADSVGLGARDTLPSVFPGRQTTVVGYPGAFVETLDTITQNQPPSVFGDVAVVAGGYDYAYWDPSRFDRSVDSILNTLRSRGVKRIVWVTLREVKPQYITASALKGIAPYSFYFPWVNDQLRNAVQRHPDLTLADWSAISDQPGLTYDAIHLNVTGQRLYSAMIADAVNNAETELARGESTRFKAAGVNGIPADAKAVAINLTVTTPRTEGYLTAYPCGTAMPPTSNLNFRSDQTVAVSAIVNVGENGDVCVFNSTETEVIVDVQGYFGANSTYQTIAAARLKDTRDNGGAIHPAGDVLVVPITGVGGVPADASGVAITLTVTDNPGPGYAAVYPCDDPPANPIALVNYIQHTATPNFSVVKPAANGTICIQTSTPAHLIVDAVGYFPSNGPITVVKPTRLIDTRPAAPMTPNTDVVLRIVGGPGQPASAQAAVVNITAADPTGIGYVVAFPCGTVPPSSTLNVVPARNTSNTAIVAPGPDGTICVRSNTSTDLLADVTAWITDGYVGLTPFRARDTRVSHS